MAKVLVINGVWAFLICSMLASSFMLYNQKVGAPAAYGRKSLVSDNSYETG
jgi:hypothetical protein